MIVVDTGPIVALLNDRDDHHQRCTEFLSTYPGPLLVPTTVFTEVCLLVERRRGTRAELAFLTDIRAGLFTLLERLNLPAVATLDHRHFRVVRPRHVAALTLLPSQSSRGAQSG